MQNKALVTAKKKKEKKNSGRKKKKASRICSNSWNTLILQKNMFPLAFKLINMLF